MKQIVIGILLATMIYDVNSSRENTKHYQYTQPHIGTLINLTIESENSIFAARTAQETFNLFREIENTMSPYKEESDIYRINNQASSTPVRVSDQTFSLIKQSIAISTETNGAFDITFASLSHLWNFNRRPFIAPDKKEINRYLPCVNYHNIVLNKTSHSVSIARSNTKIGLGAIAKGYAIQQAIFLLKKKGIKSGIVDAGGDIQVIGYKHGAPWLAGLRHPRANSLLMAIPMHDGDSIATSGDYERYVIYKGLRYHHILDPKTGYPTKTFSSVSVISKDAVISDGYATALFVMGKKRAITFAKQKKNILVIFIDLNMKISASQRLKGRIQPIKKMEIEWF